MDNTNPLIDPPPKEVPLTKAPLVLVIAQVRFSPILSIEEKSFIRSFQEAIRDKYPILKYEHTILTPQGLISNEPQVTWRFLNAEKNWIVSLAPDFLAIETTAYLSRRDFLNRLKTVLEALDEHIKPSIVERFGMRYVDQIVEPAVKDIAKLLRSEFTGIVTSSFREYINQSVNQCLFNLPSGDDQIIARWGLVPAGGIIETEALEAINEPSFLLDFDMSLSKNRNFNVETLIKEAERFAERLYTFFRWAVTDEFLRYFGGEE